MTHAKNASAFNLAKALKTVRIYDNGGVTADRFTAVFMNEPERAANLYGAYGMSEKPYHPQGVGQYCSATPGRHLGRRIKYNDLTEDCQKLIASYLKPGFETETVKLPAYWGSALVNGDFTGLTNEEEASVNAWLEENPQYGECLSASDYPEIEMFEQQICDVLEFTFPIRVQH
jgi:hypothetical protein